MKKFSKKLIYHGIVSGICLSAFIFFYCLLSFQPEDEFIIESTLIVQSAIISSVVLLLYIIYKVLFYELSGYEIKETQIICQRGVIFKKRSVLDYSKINSVNKKQGLIQKLFGISYLMIDSGSTSRAHQAEIMILEDSLVVNKLYNEFKAIDINNPVLHLDLEKDTNVIENEIEENLYQFKSKSKLIYTLLNSISIFIIAIFIVVAIFSLLFLIYYFAENDGEELKIIDVIFISISLFFAIILIGTLSYLFRAFIGYYNFRITKVNDNINVEYGLFMNNQNSFSISKVKGIIITQGILQRIFRLASIKIEVIGYVEDTNNDKQGAIGILIPLCKLSDVIAYLEKIVPSHIPIKQENKSKAFLPFISWNSIIAFFLTILCLIPAILCSLSYNSTIALIVSSSIIGGLFAIYEFLLIIGSIFAYYVQDIQFDLENITIYNGAYIKNTTVIKKSDIIAIEDITTAYRAKKGIYSYKIHFHTNALNNTKLVKIVDEKYKDILLGCMKY